LQWIITENCIYLTEVQPTITPEHQRTLP